ncbi:MAG: DUF4924 family protein [Tannerellaceae bacterium]|jgi:hypothetical protein|nr:DUF4924 family protein [Tannerellaceae bacterium]
MIIAQQKRKENIAEYILYMWQVEDLIRAAHFDEAQIRKMIVSRYDCSEFEREKIAHWYENLAQRMIAEGVTEKGHLLANTSIIAELSDFHLRMLQSSNEAVYQSNYYIILPHIVDLRAKAGSERIAEIETCFTALYGYLTLKLQSCEISPSTEEAMRQVAGFIAMLTSEYGKIQKITSN